ncbi:hypothetical protein [[Clostridium] aminophilum]|uniref:hypothetical protein n=1 Tax=[Clostridium] aminophilum TaxID=1526 RepID=UPI000943D62A|nr:hypothetical protein [[Clostridium] aminophilum]
MIIQIAVLLLFHSLPSFEKFTLKPNSMQEEFIVNLRKIIQNGKNKALLISATGDDAIIQTGRKAA